MPAKTPTAVVGKPALVRVKREPGTEEPQQLQDAAARAHAVFGTNRMRQLAWSGNVVSMEPAVYGREAKLVALSFIELVTEKALAAVVGREHSTVSAEDIHQALEECGVTYVGGGQPQS